ncbi:MAG: RICIN domain-containing protein [Dehalococcoidia bacterium]|nr:RICIN domain-containing protein [Dehalococcoidia bacterium]
MKRFVLFALSVLLVVSVLTGCGKKSSGLDPSKDSDGDGVLNGLEVAGYYWKDGEFVKWNGTDNVTYYRTDPTQFSTDQDPYGDGMEVSGVKMDTSVAAPGNHPLVPAYPDIYASMSSYDVIPKATIQSSSGGSAQSAWSNEVTNELSMETSWSITTSVEANIGIKGAFEGAKVSVSSTIGGKIGSRHQTTNSTSGFSQQDWTEATTTDPTQAAKVKLRLRFENRGTAAAQNIIPTIALMLEDKTIVTYKLPEDSKINVLAVNKTFPEASEWVVGDEAEYEIVLTMDELRSIQLGVPLFIDVPQIEAGVLEQDSEGHWQLVDTWAEYQPRMDGVCSRLSVDLGNGNVKTYRVFAKSKDGPQVTLREALSWTVGCTETDNGTEIMGEPVGYWRFGFSQNAIGNVISQLSGEAGDDLLDVVLDAGWDINIKAPSGNDTPDIVWVYAEEQEGSVLAAACVVDDFDVSKVLFKSSLDATGEEMTLISGGAGIYTIQLPGYTVTAQEVIEATNDRGKTATRSLSLPLPPTVAEGYNVITSAFSNKCISVQGASADNGANVAQYLYQGGDSQIWTLDYLGDGYYKIINKGSGKVLEVANSRTEELVNVQQNAWADSDNQKWRIEPLADGYFSITARHSGKCLEIETSASDLANIRQATFKGTSMQKWVLQAPDTYPALLTDTYVFSAKHSGLVAEVTGGSAAEGALVSQSPYSDVASQKWELRPVGDGYFNIVSRNSGRYLGYTGTNLQQWNSTGGDDQKWEFVSLGAGCYEIVNKQNSQCWSVESGGTTAGANLLLEEYAAKDWQQWKMQMWVKVTVDRVVCTMADDEGAGNNPDMDRFKVWANAFDRTGPGDEPGVQINPVDQAIWDWSTSGEWTVGVGGYKNVGLSIYLAFDAVNYDFDSASLKLNSHARDYDTTSADEWGYGNTTIYGAHFLDNGGRHVFQVSSSDFRFNVEITLSQSGRWN